MAESSHGAYYGKDEEGMKPLDQQYQFFGELGFPVKQETEAWKEKVSLFVALHCSTKCESYYGKFYRRIQILLPII